MRLKKLEIYGFKSFAKRTEIIFGEGITGIVGPNGSGKSNIGDAVRWVLGEQSAKTLRGGSMSDVIFGGTQLRKPMSYCEVTLTFDNADHFLPVDYAEAAVTRRVYRSGESEYYLNRSSCRLKDIVDLFRDTGIGKEGYSIIGQGRIDDILSRKSEDRRQVFEEAAGIVKFRARKEEADKKLARTRENAARVDDILEELNRQLKPLEKQAENARKYLALSGEMKVLDMNLFLRRSESVQEKIAALSGDIASLQAVMDDRAGMIEETIAARDSSQDEIGRLDEKLASLRSVMDGLTAEFADFQAELSGLSARAEARQSARERGESDLQRTLSLLREAESGITEGSAGTGELEQQLKQAEEAEADAISSRQALENEVTVLEQRLEEAKQALIDTMNRAANMKSSRARLSAMESQVTSRIAEVEQEGESLREGSERLEQLFHEAKDRLNHEQSYLSELEAKQTAAEGELRDNDTVLNRARVDFDRQSGELRGSSSRYETLREVTRDMEGYSGAVRCAVQYSREHHISGVRGVLSQLIAVPQKLEVAIDMALGAAQQNIVTENEDIAKELIDYLRRGRMGRATFLPMTSVRSKLLSDRERQCLSMPGCLGVASSLITFPEEYRGIVENLLGRTVISDNLDNGIAIMRACGHSFRLVTLTGDVMHSGGSMTGGSVSQKGVNFLSRERELKEMQEKIRSMKAENDRLKGEIALRQDRKTQLKQALALCQSDCHAQEVAVAREQERLKVAESDCERQQTLLEGNASALQQLKDSLADIISQIQSISDEGEGGATAEECQQLSEQLSDEVSAKRGALRQSQQQETDCIILRQSLSQQLETLRRDSSRLQRDRERLKGEESSLQCLLQQLAQEEQQDSTSSATLRRKLEENQAAQGRQQEVISSLEHRRADFQQRLKQLLQELEDLHASSARDSDKLHRLDIAKQRSEAELKQQQDKIWDTYQMTYTDAQAFRQPEMDMKQAAARAAELAGEIRELGSVNVNAVEEYAATKQRRDELSAQQEDLRKAESDLQQLIAGLLKQMEKTFVQSFTQMQGYFSETFTRLFGGGHAELKLTDIDDPLNCGIEVNAQPPGKKLQLLSLLSGGERALTAIAILFAMLKLKPTPFCILDEIEAALDDANIGYYADYLKEYSRDTQFIVITHRKGTMERCNSLYGVAMEEQGVSKMVSVSLQDYEG